MHFLKYSLKILANIAGRGGYSRRPIYLSIRSSKAFIVSSCALALFTDCFLYGIVRGIALIDVR
jgi:hypothetical protein